MDGTHTKAAGHQVIRRITQAQGGNQVKGDGRTDGLSGSRLFAKLAKEARKDPKSPARNP